MIANPLSFLFNRVKLCTHCIIRVRPMIYSGTKARHILIKSPFRIMLGEHRPIHKRYRL